MGVVSSSCYGAGDSLVTGIEDSWCHLIQGPLIKPSIQWQAVELGHLITTDAVLKNKDAVTEGAKLQQSILFYW